MRSAEWTWDDWPQGQIIQCGCGRCIVWRGTDNARERGWGAKWKNGPDGFVMSGEDVNALRRELHEHMVKFSASVGLDCTAPVEN